MRKNILIAILIFLSALLLSEIGHSGDFAVGSTEFNNEGYLTLGEVNQRNPKQSYIFGIRPYGFSYGQFELGRTWNIRSQNNGGFILHGLNKEDERGISAIVGLEPFSGYVKAGSQNGSNKYFFAPAGSTGFEFRGLDYSLVLVAKIGGLITNFDEPNDVFEPTYAYQRGYGAYLNTPGIVSFGYNHTWYKDHVRESTNIMLFNAISIGYEDSHREKMYTIIIDL